MKLLTTITALALTAGFSAQALEPHKDRARVQSMQAELLLPDNTTLNIDMDFDCGSKWQDTAVIVTSEYGAKLVAAGQAHLFGEEAGEAVMAQWNNKRDPNDPRKPTFIVVKEPEHYVNTNGAKTLDDEQLLVASANFWGVCGKEDHPPR